MINEPEFKSLNQARTVRDRLAAQALEDIEDAFEEEGEAKALIESICCAKGKWREDLNRVARIVEWGWDGDGLPDWSYLSTLGSVIAWIQKTEKEAVEEASLG